MNVMGLKEIVIQNVNWIRRNLFLGGGGGWTGINSLYRLCLCSERNAGNFFTLCCDQRLLFKGFFHSGFNHPREYFHIIVEENEHDIILGSEHDEMQTCWQTVHCNAKHDMLIFEKTFSLYASRYYQKVHFVF